MNAKQYLQSICDVADRHFAPDGIYHGVDGALRFGREIGYGLAGCEDGEKEIGTTYSALVRHTFGRTGGVPVNAKTFYAQVRDGMAKARKCLTL